METTTTTTGRKIEVATIGTTRITARINDNGTVTMTGRGLTQTVDASVWESLKK